MLVFIYWRSFIDKNGYFFVRIIIGNEFALLVIIFCSGRILIIWDLEVDNIGYSEKMSELLWLSNHLRDQTLIFVGLK